MNEDKLGFFNMVAETFLSQKKLCDYYKLYNTKQFHVQSAKVAYFTGVTNIIRLVSYKTVYNQEEHHPLNSIVTPCH